MSLDVTVKVARQRPSHTVPRPRWRAAAALAAAGLTVVLAGCAPLTREDCEAKGGTWRVSYALMASTSTPRKRATKPALDGRTRRPTHYCEGAQA